jgi:hypothetical protein
MQTQRGTMSLSVDDHLLGRYHRYCATLLGRDRKETIDQEPLDYRSGGIVDADQVDFTTQCSQARHLAQGPRRAAGGHRYPVVQAGDLVDDLVSADDDTVVHVADNRLDGVGDQRASGDLGEKLVTAEACARAAPDDDHGPGRHVFEGTLAR